MSPKKPLFIALFLAVAAGAAALVAVVHRGHGDSPAHAHGGDGAPPTAAEHSHHAEGPGLATDQLTLDSGKKWQTDAALRDGMSGIRADVEAAVGPIHGGKYAPADYEKLATGIEAKVNAVIASCKLPPAADAQLHLVVADLFAAAAEMKAGPDRSAGVVKALTALERYGQFFDQPGWTTPTH